MLRTFFIILVVFLTFQSCIEGEKIILQNPAPEISTEKLLNEESDLATLIDGEKTIVLEFWATWCAPCIKAIPHINQLVEKFDEREDVVFLAITEETDEAKVRRFMEKHQMKASVGLDLEGQTVKNYQVNDIPTLFLINKDGIVKWSGHPELLTSEMLENLIYTREIGQE